MDEGWRQSPMRSGEGPPDPKPALSSLEASFRGHA